MGQPCDEWQEACTAANAAGRWAARRLACSCSLWHLARGGEVSVHVQPADSPVAAWLEREGYGAIAGNGLLVPIVVAADDLRPAAHPTTKAQSILVRRAYANAFCSVLAEEAGVATEIQLRADSGPLLHHAPGATDSTTFQAEPPSPSR